MVGNCILGIYENFWSVFFKETPLKYFLNIIKYLFFILKTFLSVFKTRNIFEKYVKGALTPSVLIVNVFFKTVF